MAERPDYEKGIALLSNPARSIVTASKIWGANAIANGTTEVYTFFAPAGTVARVVALDGNIVVRAGTDGGDMRYIISWDIPGAVEDPELMNVWHAGAAGAGYLNFRWSSFTSAGGALYDWTPSTAVTPAEFMRRLDLVLLTPTVGLEFSITNATTLDTSGWLMITMDVEAVS